MDWSAKEYLRFEDQRMRPARDLLSAVPDHRVGVAIDLGCGPGNSTGLLVERFAGADVSGLDSSPAMLQRAAEALPEVSFAQGDISRWWPDRRYDLIFANAVLQWLPGHATLLPRLAGFLSDGGSLAIQMPDNLDEPCHIAMQETAREGGWSSIQDAAAAERTEILSAREYYRVLTPGCRRVDVWRTVYHHPLEGAGEIVEWFKSSGLRPYLKLLAGSDRADFLAAYLRRIREAYPTVHGGKVLLSFPRLFIVATR